MFMSYLSNRKQIVKCHNEISHMCDIDIGAPQGSVLGPTVEHHLTVTSLVRKNPNYSHPGSVPNCIPQCN